MKRILLKELFAKDPKESSKEADMQILRKAIIAEFDAISLYEQFAELAYNPKVKKVFLDIAKEEKTHIGEFETLLKVLDPEYTQEKLNGKQEVEEL